MAPGKPGDAATGALAACARRRFVSRSCRCSRQRGFCSRAGEAVKLYKEGAVLLLCRRISFVSCILAALAAATGAQPPRIRLATLAPKGTSLDRLLRTMGEQWSKAPEGGVSLVVYTDGTMGSEHQIVQRMRVGQLQAGLLTTDGLAAIDPSVRALQPIPLMYRSSAEEDYVRSHMVANIEKRMEERVTRRYASELFLILG